MKRPSPILQPHDQAPLPCTASWPARIIANCKTFLQPSPDSGSDVESAGTQARTWKLWQVEPARSCNISCIMCPWVEDRARAGKNGFMDPAIWDALVPYLNQVESIDFTGGGEPLLQRDLFGWIRSAKDAGCRTGFLTNGQLLSPKHANQCIDVGMDWIGFSVDGTDALTFESIRRGANFATVCRNISFLTANRPATGPMVLINFVMMNENGHQFEEIIRLAEELGVDQVNFKNCDVTRRNYGYGHGLMDRETSGRVKKTIRELKRAERLAEKRGIATTSFSLVPEEQPICRQDPRTSLFIGYDGSIAPCINLAMGGPSHFLDEDVNIPTCRFGMLPGDNLETIWQTESYRRFRNCFASRNRIYNQKLARADFGRDLIKLNEAFRSAAGAMTAPPDGCRVCHYLYDL